MPYSVCKQINNIDSHKNRQPVTVCFLVIILLFMLFVYSATYCFINILPVAVFKVIFASPDEETNTGNSALNLPVAVL
jgi:hypothetical protein